MSSPNQVLFVTLEQLVPTNHLYKKLLQAIDFRKLCSCLHKINKNHPELGYGMIPLFKILLLQFMEDLSDREMERFLQENTAAKYFCGFGLKDKTPHFTLFSKVRSRIGPAKLSKLFRKFRDQLKKEGHLPEVFTFVYASHLVAKNQVWKERDEAIAAGYEKLNNEMLAKIAVDKDARIGCKGKNKFWYGYKQHVSVDMQTGMINKVALTAANLPDSKGVKHICPTRGVVFGDKGYCGKEVDRELKKRGCDNATIKRNNMKGKNRDQDRWFTQLRAPYERVFSKRNRRVRYRGLVKNIFLTIFQSLCFNMKRFLVLLDSPPLSSSC